MKSFSVRIFPSDDWHDIELVPQGKPGQGGSFTLIDVKAIKELIKETLSLNEAGIKELTYNVRFLTNKPRKQVDMPIGIKVDYNIPLAELKDLTHYEFYVFKKAGERLEEVLNHQGEEEQILQVEMGYYNRVRVFIMPRPREVARLFYTLPTLHPTFGYTISIFSGREEEMKELSAFTAAVLEYNEKVTKPPLYLVNPVLDKELNSPERIVFLARNKGKIVGYCACNILDYRTELQVQLEETLWKLYEDDDEDSPYYYDTRPLPRNLFEIEGLSVHPLERGNELGRVLLYVALHFIRDPIVSANFFNVSHVMAQSASSITKYLLTNDFDFSYHGSNNFLNEDFVETLSRTTKSYLMRIIRDCVAYYNSLFSEKQKLLTLRQTSAKSKKDLFVSVVHLYQLYYLLILYGAQSLVSFQAQNDPIDEFILLFQYVRNVTNHKSSYEDLEKYFEANEQALLAYKASGARYEDVKMIEEKIYTKTYVYGKYDAGPAPYQLPPRHIDIGFLVKLDYADPEVKKETYTAGYEILYAAVYNVTTLQPTNNTAALNIFDNINSLLMTDLMKPLNYEIASYEKIEKELMSLLDTGILFKRTAVIRQTLDLLRTRVSLLKRNVDRNSDLAHKVYNIPYYEMAGFDTFISYEKLADEEKWNAISNKLNEKLASTAAAKAQKKQPKPQIELPIPLPDNREALFREIYLVKGLLIRANNDRNEILKIGNKEYRVLVLKRHFVRLMGMRDSFDQRQEEDNGENVDVMNGEEDYVYKLEDFIDSEPLQGDVFFRDNITNNELI